MVINKKHGSFLFWGGMLMWSVLLVCFFVCVVSTCCKTDERVFLICWCFLFACVFCSYSTLSSLGHRSFLYEYRLKLNVIFCIDQSCIFSIITPVFSVTWSSEIILICCDHSKIGGKKKIILLFIKVALNWSKVRTKTFIM